MATPLPSLYRSIFAVVEPLGLLSGAAFALLLPSTFYSDYLPSTSGPVVGNSDPRSVMVSSGMGSCMLILGLVGISVLPTAVKSLKKQPYALQRILRSYLLCLFVGDALHIGVTLAMAPKDVRWDVTKWTILLCGNIAGTALPCFFRIGWFLGIGRTVFTEGDDAKAGGGTGGSYSSVATARP